MNFDGATTPDGEQSTDSGGPTEQQVQDYALQLFEDARSELGRADSKGSILLTGGGIVLSALTGAIIGGDWTPSKLDSFAGRAAFFLGFVAVIGGIICIGMAVIPQVRKPPESEYAFYFGQLAHIDRAEAGRRIANTVNVLTERAVDQAWWMSKIALRKYRLIRRSMLFFAFAFVMAILTPTLERLL
jgi:hypothetical protein